ncbi:MAG: DUF2510 domain-containing protein [Acidimicrobiales bacterium]
MCAGAWFVSLASPRVTATSVVPFSSRVSSTTSTAVASSGRPTGTLTAATYPNIARVVVGHTLPNFTARPPGPANGPLTVSEFGALSSDPKQAQARFRTVAGRAGFAAYLRLWTDAPRPGMRSNDIVITLYRIAVPTEAASFAAGSRTQYERAGTASTFSVPGIPGAHGYTVTISSPTAVTEQVVIFRSGPYIAIVQLASSTHGNNPAALDPSDAITVGFEQYFAILHALRSGDGTSPAATLDAPSGHAISTRLVLGIAGALVAVTAFGWIVARRGRRRRARVAAHAPSIGVRARPYRVDTTLNVTRPPRVAVGAVPVPVPVATGWSTEAEPASVPEVEPASVPARSSRGAARSTATTGNGSGATPVGRLDVLVPGTRPGWRPDPSGSPDLLRYWDGEAWSTHVVKR